MGGARRGAGGFASVCCMPCPVAAAQQGSVPTLLLLRRACRQKSLDDGQRKLLGLSPAPGRKLPATAGGRAVGSPITPLGPPLVRRQQEANTSAALWNAALSVFLPALVDCPVRCCRLRPRFECLSTHQPALLPRCRGAARRRPLRARRPRRAAPPRPRRARCRRRGAAAAAAPARPSPPASWAPPWRCSSSWTSLRRKHRRRRRRRLRRRAATRPTALARRGPTRPPPRHPAAWGSAPPTRRRGRAARRRGRRGCPWAPRRPRTGACLRGAAEQPGGAHAGRGSWSCRGCAHLLLLPPPAPLPLLPLLLLPPCTPTYSPAPPSHPLAPACRPSAVPKGAASLPHRPDGRVQASSEEQLQAVMGQLGTSPRHLEVRLRCACCACCRCYGRRGRTVRGGAGLCRVPRA